MLLPCDTYGVQSLDRAYMAGKPDVLIPGTFPEKARRLAGLHYRTVGRLFVLPAANLRESCNPREAFPADTREMVLRLPQAKKF